MLTCYLIIRKPHKQLISIAKWQRKSQIWDWPIRGKDYDEQNNSDMVFLLPLCLEGQHPGVSSSLLMLRLVLCGYHLIKLPVLDLWGSCAHFRDQFSHGVASVHFIAPFLRTRKDWWVLDEVCFLPFWAYDQTHKCWCYRYSTSQKKAKFIASLII